MINYIDDVLIDELIADEGFKTKSYKDTKNKWTIGVGHLLGVGPEFANIIWSERKVVVTLMQDINTSLFYTQKQVPTFSYWSDNRQRVLVNMMFNLGPTKFAGFDQMNKALNNHDVKWVYKEMLDSKWAKIDVPNRAHKLAEQWLAG